MQLFWVAFIMMLVKREGKQMTHWEAMIAALAGALNDDDLMIDVEELILLAINRHDYLSPFEDAQ